METTKNKLNEHEKDFFDNLKNYINKPIYFYGSIQRNDYMQKTSDIDIDIFTDNEYSTLLLLQNFLNVNKNEFKKIMYRTDNKLGGVIPGFKIKYNDGISLEISVYNEKYKDDILNVHRKIIDLPFYISYMLLFLKFLHYNLGVLPQQYYLYLKNTLVSVKNTKFLTTSF